MSIDARTETLITLAEAAQRLPGRPSIVTVWRWWSRGIRGQRLDTIIIGGRRFTSVEALDRWIADRTAATTPHSPTADTSPHRARQLAAAEARAAALGI